MELNISISGKEESERLVSIIQLGLLSVLEKEIISIEEAEGYLFNPFTVSKLERYGLSKEVIDIIKEGCELEDIQSLMPEKLLSNIIRLKEQILSNIAVMPSPVLPTEKIIK
ncbi:DUF3969 family protein [Priestia koreensis]|uniref:DUF3969 family protein n=1 Tax=Priestia koreensis TaxID=284581 RepID=UPI001F587D60|nr:DUF3969 family protein [Priestia koreensis]UNL86378.1 DUF3969 family protein [Priestia koreensis]